MANKVKRKHGHGRTREGRRRRRRIELDVAAAPAAEPLQKRPLDFLMAARIFNRVVWSSGLVGFGKVATSAAEADPVAVKRAARLYRELAAALEEDRSGVVVYRASDAAGHLVGFANRVAGAKWTGFRIAAPGVAEALEGDDEVRGWAKAVAGAGGSVRFLTAAQVAAEAVANAERASGPSISAAAPAA